MGKLSARIIASIDTRGQYGDGRGLWLQQSAFNTKSWLLRYMIGGRARSMGLGPYPEVSLAEARDLAHEYRKQARAGNDPIDARNEKRMVAKLAAAKSMTFGECVDAYLAAQEKKWTNAKHRAQWETTLTKGAAALCKLPVAEIDTALVMKVLQPIWHKTPETASRLRGRIERVLAYATVSGYRSGENPARWGGHLREVLPAKSQIHDVKPHEALPYQRIPAFMAELRKLEGIPARALEFAILNANRSGEVRYARWDEIDFEKKIWVIPPNRMKGGREHRVPLQGRGLDILKSLPRERGNPFIFVGDKSARPIGEKAMLIVVAELIGNGTTVHGFRSGFKDWCAEITSFPDALTERCLAHTERNKVKAAYQRGDLIDKRRQVMTAWSKYCESKPVEKSGDVVALHKARL